MRLTAHAVTVRFDADPVLDNVSARVEPGEVLGLIGPNGAGKSTLLRVMAGLRAPDAGQVDLDGRNPLHIAPRELARQLAFLPQGATVHWPLTVERLVELGRLPHRRVLRAPGRVDREAVEQALERTGTMALRHRSIATLSGGERMRALVARLLAVEAPVLLADEPVAALDPYYQLQFMELFAAEAERGRAVVVVLHDLPLAARYCHRLLLLDHGRVAADGTPSDVLAAANVERVYRVEALSGQYRDRLYVLPWQRAGSDRAAP